MSSPEEWAHPEPGAGPAASTAQPTPEQVIAGLRATTEGGADLIQLLTP
jgi:2-oxoisovalerate dehydrogenase E1 component alpha subunit